jgi:hypothetical protein
MSNFILDIVPVLYEQTFGYNFMIETNDHEKKKSTSAKVYLV